MNFTATCFSSVVQLIYPATCKGCGEELPHASQVICLDCIASLPVTGFEGHRNNPVEKIFWGRLPVISASSHIYFTKQSVLQNLLHELKYRGKKEIGWWFGKRMAESLRREESFGEITALIPLPLFAKKEKKRGYNQAAEICWGISEMTSIPVLDDIVIRSSGTESQTRKSRLMRWQNMEGKFILKNSRAVEGKHVMLVDDVLTTGATLEACGQELLKAEQLKLSIATVAYTIL